MSDTESRPTGDETPRRETNTDRMDPPEGHEGATDDADDETGLQYGTHGRCTAYARSADRQCKRPAVGEHGKCDKHGGASTGPQDTTALEGNDHAEGNAGGGAPEGNFNAGTYGAWCDWRKAYERFEGETKAYIDKLAESYVENAKALAPPEDIREKARELATRHWLSTRADAQIADEGIVTTRDIQVGDETLTVSTVNPGLKADTRHTSRMLTLMGELQAFPSPDGRPCSEW